MTKLGKVKSASFDDDLAVLFLHKDRAEAKPAAENAGGEAKGEEAKAAEPKAGEPAAAEPKGAEPAAAEPKQIGRAHV